MVRGKITLDMLTQNSVSVRIQKIIEQNGEAYEAGQPHRRAYVNSVRGREQIQQELEEPYLSAVFAVWGDTPTVNEELQE